MGFIAVILGLYRVMLGFHWDSVGIYEGIWEHFTPMIEKEMKKQERSTGNWDHIIGVLYRCLKVIRMMANMISGSSEKVYARFIQGI